MSPRFAARWAVLAVLACSAPAFAQDVVKLNEEGIVAFSEGRFEEAAQKFNQAYAIKPEAPLKKNEALAWFKANKCSEALAAAKEYLALNAGDEVSTREAQTVAVRCYIERAEAELAAGNFDLVTTAVADARANSPAPEDEATLVRIEADANAKREAAEAERLAAQAAAAKAAEEAARAERDAQRGGSARTLGLALTAGGGAIVLGTLVYHIALATGAAPKFKDAAAAGNREDYDRLGKRLETGNWLIPTLYTVGLATSGLGVFLWWNAGSGEQAPQTATMFGLESVGVTASWRF